MGQVVQVMQCPSHISKWCFPPVKFIICMSSPRISLTRLYHALSRACPRRKRTHGFVCTDYPKLLPTITWHNDGHCSASRFDHGKGYASLLPKALAVANTTLLSRRAQTQARVKSLPQHQSRADTPSFISR